MAEKSGISWTNNTFNPWWGCTKVSPACTHCYAERDSKRFGYEVWGLDAPRKTQSERYWNDPIRWNKRAKETGIRERVFCASMADVFEDRRDLDPLRDRLWGLIEKTDHLDWLLLTKRPESWSLLPWKDQLPNNIWLGITAENQEWWDRRKVYLASAPKSIKFISAEPLLGPLVLGDEAKLLDWVITGAESGTGARFVDENWIRALRDECVSQKIKFFYKQAMVDGRVIDKPYLDGVQWLEYPTND